MHSNLLKKTKEVFLDIFFPKFCLGCKKEGEYLCSKCLLFVSEASFICPVCQKSEYFGRRHQKCKRKDNLDGLVAMWDYEGLAKKLVHETKYKSLIEIPQEMTECALRVIKEDENRFSEFLSFFFQEEAVLSFVPLSRKKKNERGFNQAEEIAKNIGIIASKKPPLLLRKTKETKQQITLSKEERLQNVKGSFVCNFKKKEAPQRVVIFDDVWTSGATMKECVKTLKKGGVKEVWGFVFCKVA